jgi:hypothetical protein
MKISLHPHHQAHVQSLGIEPPQELETTAEEHESAMRQWEKTGFVGEELRMKVIGHLAWKQHNKAKVIEEPKRPKWLKSLLGSLAVVLFICLATVYSHCQFSKISTVTVTDGSTSLFTASPFQIMFSGCTVSGTGSAMTVTCAGSAANPGGSAHQLQVNSAGTAFAGIANGTAGQVLCSNGTSSDPSMCDPIVSGPDAPGVAPTKNPVQIGLFDGTNVERVLGSVAGRLSVDVNSAPTTAVTGTFFQATQPVSATSLPLPTGAATLAKQPALGTAGSASADVISIQGIASMTAVKTDGSGVTQPVSGTVTANQGGTWTVQPGNTANTTAWKVDGSAVTQPVSGSVTVTQATGTNLHTVCDSGCSSSTAPADGATFTEGTTSFSPFGGYFRTSPTSLTTDHMGAVGMTATRHLFVNLPDALPAGTNVIGHVIADTGSTTAVTGNVASTVADGANVTLGAKADAKSTATDTTAVTIMQVLKEISALEQAPASRAVSNAGTFATQATLSAETTKVIGTARVVGNAGANLDAATGAAPPANAILHAGLGSGATGGFLVAVPVSDTYKNINIATATTTLLVTGVSGRQVRIGSLHLVTTLANNVALIEGTGATCGTGTAGMAGGTTAASGYNFAANGGLTIGSGLGTVMQTATTGDSVCIVTSAATQLSGGLQYAIY